MAQILLNLFLLLACSAFANALYVRPSRPLRSARQTRAPQVVALNLTKQEDWQALGKALGPFNATDSSRQRGSVSNTGRVTFSTPQTVLLDTVSVSGVHVACASGCWRFALFTAASLEAKTSGGNPDYTCFDTLAEAVAASGEGDLIQVTNDIEITESITLPHSLALAGCPRKATEGDSAPGRQTIPIRGPTVLTRYNTERSGVLFMSGTNKTYTFSNLNFVNEAPYASLLRTLERKQADGNWNYFAAVNISLSHCTFKNYRTLAPGGSVLYVNTAKGLQIDHCQFSNNTVALKERIFGGAGTVWVVEVREDAEFSITGSLFQDNSHEFNHGLGGGVGLDFLSGRFLIDNTTFYNNRASGGAGLYVQSVEAIARIDIVNSIFYRNVATEYGWGSRGAATWVQFIKGLVAINQSYFVENIAPAGRGGVVANNQVIGNASVVFDRDMFFNNTAADGAAVWDTLQGFEPTASITFKDNCKFAGNVGRNTSLVVRLGKDGEMSMNEEDWAGVEMDFYG